MPLVNPAWPQQESVSSLGLGVLGDDLGALRDGVLSHQFTIAVCVTLSQKNRQTTGREQIKNKTIQRDRELYLDEKKNITIQNHHKSQKTNLMMR